MDHVNSKKNNKRAFYFLKQPVALQNNEWEKKRERDTEKEREKKSIYGERIGGMVTLSTWPLKNSGLVHKTRNHCGAAPSTTHFSTSQRSAHI